MKKFFGNLIYLLNNQYPSKWGRGTGLLWRGNTSKLYLKAFFGALLNKNNNIARIPNRYLFESCRVAIYHFAKYSGLKSGDKVQIMGFTCDAVTNALDALNCNIILYDCNDKMECTKFQFSEDTKLIICQISFGVPALSKEILAKAHAMGISILLDKSLSYGIEDFSDESLFQYPTVMSFEVSKSITIGWGGLLILPMESFFDKFIKYYSSLGKVSFLDDFSRVFKTIINLLMVNNGNKFNYWLWLLFRVLRLHRASVKSETLKYKNKSAMGELSKKIFYQHYQQIPKFLEVSNKNHNILKELLISFNLEVISEVNQRYSTPRIVFLVENDIKIKLIKWLKFNNFELGVWFDHMPLFDNNNTNNYIGTLSLMEKVVNLPCHGSISRVEIDRLIASLKEFFIEEDYAIQ
jgi:dTDP-4-amino-4,6-dideoxygalactose transaminase